MSMDEWEREYYWKLMDACDARANGQDRAALKFLDEAEKLFARQMKADPRRKIHSRSGRPKGAKNKRKDPDTWTLNFMRWVSKESGVTDAETLAKDAAELIGVMPSIHRGASKTAFIKRVSGKFRRLAKK
jgi:hypothetical protein